MALTDEQRRYLEEQDRIFGSGGGPSLVAQTDAGFRLRGDSGASGFMERPNRPQWQSTLGNSGGLEDIYKINTNLAGEIRDQASPGYNKFSQMALSDGFSPWVGMQQRQLEMGAGRARAAADASAQGAAAGGFSSLAQSGGARGGARERLAQAAQRQAMLAKQDINANLQGAQAGVYQQDIQNRQNMLSQLPGLEMNRTNLWSQARQFDVGNQARNRDLALQEIAQRRAYDQNVYGQDMSAWAAGRTADAQIAQAGRW